MRRFTQKDWDAIATALAFIAAGEWDDETEQRPDFEAILDKVNERRRQVRQTKGEL
jgi:hypothetical protein